MKYRCVLLFGAPGSGKGTVGKELAGKFGMVHLSSGDIFRGLDTTSETGKLFDSYASKGELVPDEVTMKVWHEYCESLIKKGDFAPEKQILVLDGLPRTAAQAQLLASYADVLKVVVLEADTAIFVDRLKKRAEIEGRKDDADEAVLNNRMRVYKEQTMSVLQEYPEDRIAHVNADQEKLQVLDDVSDIVKPLL